MFTEVLMSVTVICFSESSIQKTPEFRFVVEGLYRVCNLLNI